MSTKLDLAKAEIKKILEAIEGIGIVHDYFRQADTEEKLLELFKWNDSYRGIEFSPRNRIEDVKEDESLPVNRNWSFFYIMQVNDESESEKTFDNQLEEIITTVNGNIDLNNTITEHYNLQLLGKTEVEIGEVLCHLAQLELKTIG